MMKRIIVVGMGSIGIRHVRVCRRFADLQPELCDSRTEGLAEAKAQLGEIRSWSSWSEALDSRPDAVIIATPHRLHSEMACEAMEAGVDVLCEKPMSDTAEGALRMAATQARTRRLLQIGFMLRFHPAIIHLRGLVQSGELGALASLRYHISSLITLENSRSRYQSELPGALIMDYVHGLDLLCWLTGSVPAAVYAKGAEIGNLPLTARPNLFAALVEFQNDLLAEIHMDYIVKPQFHELLLLGDRAMARLELSDGVLELRRREKNEREVLKFEFQVDDLYAAQLKAFLASSDGAVAEGCGPEEGVLLTTVVEALLDSARHGRRIAVDLFGKGVSV